MQISIQKKLAMSSDYRQGDDLNYTIGKIGKKGKES